MSLFIDLPGFRTIDTFTKFLKIDWLNTIPKLENTGLKMDARRESFSPLQQAILQLILTKKLKS